ncbi:ATP-binding domain-containing protein [Streptacidiphilus fuscans]|uniref:ATP-binding domain-containing protein n=1 Tax=Streptacidiphilus fuscans TaxID=2789292 RepID=UPI0038B608F9
MSLTTASAFMLRRNLIYTAITRGKQKAVLVGEEEALHRALTKAEPHRNTALARRLHALFTGAAGHPAALRVADGQLAVC